MNFSGGFTLWRQDDNGVVAGVARYPDRESADEARQTFEASGHKHHYWIAPDDESETPRSDH
ncbi:MAG: hypothetical protein ACPH3N_03010 [Alcanivorax sediminis]|uniref:hypothetical protein n=1 Tax=Alcanivorax sediminis TaxID=2663008 RepID=UPI003C615282